MYYRIDVAERGPPPPKKDVARALLLRGSVFVYLDPREPGVRVPPWLADQPQLVLQIGLDLPVPIPDLRVDDGGVSGTLSFNRAPHACAVPWEAVFALAGDDGMGVVWEESMPAEIAAEVEVAQRRDQAAREREKPSRGPRLVAIEGGAPDGASAVPAPIATHDEEPDRKARPHLRLVK